jgi:hypothetical protein
MIDSVERRYKDMLANHTEFIIPTLPTVDNIVYKLHTGETVAQYYARKGNAMRKALEELEAAFKIAETKRGEQWAVLTKAKGGSTAVSGGGNKSNTSRKSVPSSSGGGGGYGAVAPNRQSYPMQQMQPRQAPGHVPQSYYQATPATQMQSHISPATQLLMQQQAQMARMQQSMIQQQQQQQFQAQASAFPVSQISSVPSSISVAMDQSFPVSSTVDTPNNNMMMMDESITTQVTLTMQQQQQQGASGEVKPAHRYEYGDRYSEQNVRARKNPDGTVLPATAPKLLPDGTFAKPSGRQRKGMEWDAAKGCWYPVPGGGSSGSYSGSEN